MRFLLNISPIDVSFPLHRRPHLKVVVRDTGPPDVRRSPTVTIEVSNVARVPVGVSSVNVSHKYKNTFTEAAFGKQIAKLPLSEPSGDPQPPRVLDVGESVTWIANLSQLREHSVEERTNLETRSRYLDLRRIDVDRWARYGSLAIAVRNVIAKASSWRLVVAVLDDRDGLYKAGVRWAPPGGNHLNLPHRLGE